MKKHISMILATAAGAAWLAVGTPGAFAQTNVSIGVNFSNNGNAAGSHGSADTNADSMLSGDLAGVPPYAQTNWNNLGRYGSEATTILTNSAGGTDSFIANWDSGWADSTGTAAGLGTGDGKLMDGFLYSWGPGAASALSNSVYSCSINNKPLIWLAGLQSFYTNQNAECYNLVLYTTGYSYYEVTEGWIQSVTGNPRSGTMAAGADLTAHAYEQDTGPFIGTYVQTTGTNSASPTAGANYMIFRGLTNDEVLIRLEMPLGGYGSGLNGFQIIPQYPAAPTASAPTFSPSATVYAEVPVTVTEAAVGDPIHPALGYQWQVDDAGSSGVPTNNILNATNATLSVTPTNAASSYTISYDVIVTNIFGAVTSAVATLNVNPAVAPFITQDTTPGAGNGLTSVYAYAGGTMSFTAAFGGTPSTYLWQSNLVDIPGKTTTTLTLANLQVSASASYELTATNSIGSSASTPVALTVLPDPPAPNPATQKYFNQAYTNNAWAYWRFNETNDPTASAAASFQAYDYTGHGFSATYGSAVTVSNAGPQTPAFPGFDAGELAAGITASTATATLTPPALHLNGNTATFLAWINPNGAQAANAGLLINRNGADAAGFGFSGTNDELGYTWNTNSAGTYNWQSGLFVADNNWNFVAYVITPTNATLYLGNLAGGTTNFQQSTHDFVHTTETWAGGTTLLGGDSSSVNRNFNGLISEFTLFTNALSTAQIQGYFLTAIGAAGLAPSLGATSVYPGTSLYSGQNVLMSALVSGSAPVSLRWQSSPDGSTWTDIPGATAASVVVNPFTVGTVYYQLTANNFVASVTNAAVSITYNALPPTPPGVWNVNFQVTNNVLNYTTASGSGLGNYFGRGILGSGMYWNVLPDTAGAFNNVARIDSVSDLRDDGSTHSGIYCTLFSGAGFSSALVPQPLSADVGNLVNQWVTITTVTNALQFHGVPDGTYNLTCYGADGTFQDRGCTFVVHDPLNGDQTNGTVNASPVVPLAQGLNFVVFTNVHVSGGTLNVDVEPTSPVPTHIPNTEADVNGVQLQLVSYDAAPAITLNSTIVGNGGAQKQSLTLSWPEGILQTATNVLGPWAPIYAPSPITMTTTNAAQQFYRVKVR